MHVFFGIARHLKSEPDVSTIKNRFLLSWHLEFALVCLAFGGIGYFDMIVQFRLRLKL